MEAVAKRAGVGIGTLYRHFPTRTELMEAVYAEHVEELRTTARRLSEEHAPGEALTAWLRAFVTSASVKRAIFTELVATVGRDSALITSSKAAMRETVGELVSAAQQAGEIRDDVTAADVLSLVSGCTMMHLEGDQADRVLRVILDGLRP
jgi:AcrR family transcriptional regulator